MNREKKLRRWVWIFLICLMGSGCGWNAPIKGKVVFTSSRFEPDPNEKLTAFASDGVCLYEKGKIKKLQRGLINPRFSKDGKIIAVIDWTEKENDITLLRLSNNEKIEIEKRILRNHPGEFTWLPNGKELIFIALNDEFPDNLFFYDLETGEEKQLTHFEDKYGFFGSLDISPDGSKILFSYQQNRLSTEEGKESFYLMDFNGENMQKLSIFGGGDGRFSSDGKKIVYNSPYLNGQRMKEGLEVFICDLQTSRTIRVTHNNAMETEPIFSSDGKQILYIRWEDKGKSIRVMNVDGTDDREVVPKGYDIRNLDWVY